MQWYMENIKMKEYSLWPLAMVLVVKFNSSDGLRRWHPAHGTIYLRMVWLAIAIGCKSVPLDRSQSADI